MEKRPIFRFRDGNTYDGEWYGNLRQGKGTFTWRSGAVYEGEWNQNKKSGNGKITYPANSHGKHSHYEG